MGRQKFKRALGTQCGVEERDRQTAVGEVPGLSSAFIRRVPMVSHGGRARVLVSPMVALLEDTAGQAHGPLTGPWLLRPFVIRRGKAGLTCMSGSHPFV